MFQRIARSLVVVQLALIALTATACSSNSSDGSRLSLDGGSTGGTTGQGCSAPRTQCGSACVDTSSDNTHCGACGQSCSAGMFCSAGTCACSYGYPNCGGVCADTTTDAAHCGNCTTVCGAGQVCANGACACPAGSTSCDGACVDTATDVGHCGGCTTACQSGQACAGSACVCLSNLTQCGSSCVDVASDGANCGTCGHACASGQVCSSGTCATQCGGTLTQCGQDCVDTQTNVANCGACDVACPSGQSCSGASCVCPADQLKCGTTCVSAQTDAQNCGTCAHACATGQTCVGGACACPTGQTLCGAQCTNTATDNQNCGACGTVCSGGQVCGATGCACPNGGTFCNGACVDAQADGNNCGACGRVCGTNQVCSGGACVTQCGTLTQCGQSCVDVQTDGNNCGTCAHVCSGGQVCAVGVCACPNNGTFCNAACVNTQTDTSNCGACGVVCGSGAACVSGGCSGGTGGTGGTGGSGGTGGTTGGTGGTTGGTGGTTGGTGGTTGGTGGTTGGTGGTTGGTGGTTGGTGGTTGGTGGTVGSCTSPSVRVTEFDVGGTVTSNETDGGLVPISLSPMPSGGTRVAWYGGGQVHVTTLNAADTVNASVPAVALPGHDFQDIYADDTGGVVLLTRDAAGGGTLNCGQPTNLCGTPPNPAIPCYEMYLVRFNGTTEAWATELTQGSAAHPPYLNSPTDPSNVVFIWWYMHEGRIVTDGTNYAAYFGAAISVTQSGCVNIHQGDRMKVVAPTGALLTGHNSFDWGCSHSGYERIVWDQAANKFVTVCKNDAPTANKSGRLAFAPNITTIYPLDLWYSNVGDIVLGGGGGYWVIASDIRAGQTANANGLADVHLLHFTTGAPDKDIILATDSGMNDRAPHLVTYGKYMLAVWERSTATGDLAYKNTGRTMVLQVLDRTTGAVVSSPFTVPSSGTGSAFGNRYYGFKAFPDGSVAFPSAGSNSTKLKVLRVLPCAG